MDKLRDGEMPKCLIGRPRHDERRIATAPIAEGQRRSVRRIIPCDFEIQDGGDF